MSSNEYCPFWPNLKLDILPSVTKLLNCVNSLNPSISNFFFVLSFLASSSSSSISATAGTSPDPTAPSEGNDTGPMPPIVTPGVILAFAVSKFSSTVSGSLSCFVEAYFFKSFFVIPSDNDFTLSL